MKAMTAMATLMAMAMLMLSGCTTVIDPDMAIGIYLDDRGEVHEVNCSDGEDNDGDDLTDCNDPDCEADPVCPDNGGDGDADSDSDSGLPACVSTEGQCQVDVDGDGNSDWDRPIEERGWGGQLAWTPLDGNCVCPDGQSEDAVVVLSDGCVLPDADPSCTGGVYGSIENWAEELYGRRDVLYCTPVCWTPLRPRY